MLVGGLVVAGVGCGVVGSAVSLGLSRGIVWGSGVDGGLSVWMRAGSCWRLRLYWSSISVDWSVAGGIGGAAEVSGVPRLLTVVVRSMVGLLGRLCWCPVCGCCRWLCLGCPSCRSVWGSVWKCPGPVLGHGGQWAVLCREVASWDCVGCAVCWYVLGCPEAGTVFPDGAALECRWCWDVDRAVLVKGLS